MSLNIGIIDNPEPRCPVVLLLDNSYSMSGNPIQELNEGITVFKQEVEEDETASLRIEVAIISFGNKPNVLQDFITISEFAPPKLEAIGNTPMGKAIELGLDLVEKRKTIYKENDILYYQPWILLITDGEPTDDYQNAAQQVRKATAERKLNFFTVAVQNANIEKLKQIAPLDTPPIHLDGLKFKELFRWLSDSMKRTSNQKIGEQVDLPNYGGWGTATT